MGAGAIAAASLASLAAGVDDLFWSRSHPGRLRRDGQRAWGAWWHEQSVAVGVARIHHERPVMVATSRKGDRSHRDLPHA
jgi:hypothetical protein